MNFQVLSATDVVKVFEKNSIIQNDRYLAFYSSWLGGIVKDSGFFVAPMDDHLVHRGDGVFEAIRIIEGTPIDLKAHLDRMERSAASVFLSFPFSRAEVEECLKAVIAAAGPRAGMIRMYLSRGPGGFSVSPTESVGSQLYVVITTFTAVPEEKYISGVSVMMAKIPQKDAFFSQIKSCNYLQNVLLKKESLDQGFDFAVSFTEDGYLAEGPTENILILTADNRLLAPSFDYTLRGTTLIRVLKLAESLRAQGVVKDVGSANLSREDLLNAKEVMMVGTTLEVLPVSRVEKSLKSVGPVSRALRVLLQNDMKTNG